MTNEESIKKIDQRVKDLEKLLSSSRQTKKEKKPRKKSEYNIFVQKYISKNKDPSKSHKELFSDAAKAWGESKK